MADSELVQALDYILNRSNDASVEILAEAVARRRRELSVFSAFGSMSDPQKAAKDITGKINASIEAGIGGMKDSIREMIIRVIRENAPELSGSQIEALCDQWMPSYENKAAAPGILLSMIGQFVSFSRGEMNDSVDRNLREEIGDWPERYWNSFPSVVKQIITDYLKNKITEKEFKSKISLALGK